MQILKESEEVNQLYGKLVVIAVEKQNEPVKQRLRQEVSDNEHNRNDILLLGKVIAQLKKGIFLQSFEKMQKHG